MDYTKEDYVVLEKALKDMKDLTGYFERLIKKLELEKELFGDDDEGMLESIYYIVRHQNSFDINNYTKDEYIDIAYNNLVLSVYTHGDSIYLGKHFEIWNDSECYCIGTLSIEQVENILKLEGDNNG